MRTKRQCIEQMSTTLDNAIKEKSKHDYIEGFDCEEICTGKSKKIAFESNETKNILLIFMLIFFYYFIKS